jgi:acetyl esterase/lipase
MSDDILTLPPPPADARVPYGADANQFLDLRLPKRDHHRHAHPLLINIHGGFWRAKYNLDHAGHLCSALTSVGLATANLEYRRVGNQGGGWPGTFDDIRSAYRFLVQSGAHYRFDPKTILVMGHSAGGQLALCLTAHEPGVAGVISLAGVVDLRRAYQLHLSSDAVVEFLHGTPGDVPDHYREADPMQLSISHSKQRLIHGSADDVVPTDFSREYVAARQQRGGGKEEKRQDVRLVEIAGANHYDLIDPRTQAWKQVEKTVEQLLQ